MFGVAIMNTKQILNLVYPGTYVTSDQDMCHGVRRI